MAQINKIEAALPADFETREILAHIGYRADKLLLAMLTAVALTGTAPAPAQAAERDPRIVECEAKWNIFVVEGQKEGNEKQVKFATKKKLACAEDMAELIQAEKHLDDATKKADDATKKAEATKKEADEATKMIKHFDILEADRPKISAYLEGKSSLSKEEARRILREYEHAVDELMKHPGFKPNTYETLSIHKQFIEMSKKKIGQ